MGKLLFIGSFLSARRGTKGVAESLAERLNKEGIHLKLVSRFENKLLRIIDIIAAVLLDRGRIVHIDVFSGSAFRIAEIASRLSQIRKRKIILTLHGGKLAEFAEPQKDRVKRLFNGSTIIQTPSLFLQVYFRQLGYDVRYLPNSIAIDKFPFKRSEVTPFSLLWVRSFTSIYNPQLAVKILGGLRKKYPDCTLTMVGPDKGLLKETLQLAEKLGVKDALKITGPVNNEKLSSYYQSHDVYLNTTSYESFGIAVVEAAACGIPIVSAKVGEIPFIWEHEKNILLVDKYDPEEYARCITRLFENKELYNKLSNKAREKAEGFGWEKIKPLWVDLLTNIQSECSNT